MEYQTLSLLFKCSKEFSHGKIHEKDLSDTECMICTYVYANQDCSQEDVAVALKTDRTTIAKAMVTLEAKGCIERTPHPMDKRKKQLRITPAGEEKIIDLLDIHNEWLAEIMKSLSKKEQTQFENYCVRLLNAAEAYNAAHEVSGGYMRKN